MNPVLTKQYASVVAARNQQQQGIMKVSKGVGDSPSPYRLDEAAHATFEFEGVNSSTLNRPNMRD